MILLIYSGFRQAFREYHEDMTDNERRVRKAFASVDADGNLIEKRVKLEL